MDAGIAAIDLDLAAVPKATISVETDRSNGSPRRGCRVRGRSRPVIHSDSRYRLPTLTQLGSWSWVRSDRRPRRSASIARRRVVSSWAIAVMWLSPLAPSIISPQPFDAASVGAPHHIDARRSGRLRKRRAPVRRPDGPMIARSRTSLTRLLVVSSSFRGRLYPLEHPSHRGKLARW
jgi:hypothetical protein